VDSAIHPTVLSVMSTAQGQSSKQGWDQHIDFITSTLVETFFSLTGPHLYWRQRISIWLIFGFQVYECYYLLRKAKLYIEVSPSLERKELFVFICVFLAKLCC
jgi:hypothetical protein